MHYIVPSARILEDRKGEWEGGGACRARFTGIKIEISRLRELKQSFHESRKIRRLILFVAHIVLQSCGVDYFELYIHKK